MAVQSTDLHLHDRLCKFSACRTSKQTTDAPMVGTGLALAAVGFVDVYMWGLGQARVCLHISHTGSRYATMQSCDLTSVDLC